MFKFLIPCLILFHLSYAAEIRPFPRSVSARAIDVVKNYLKGPAHLRTQLWNDLRDLDPSGAAFVDEALKLIAADQSKWRSNADPRSSMLIAVRTSIQESLPWGGEFEKSTLKQSIHQSAQKMLQVLAHKGRHQNSLLEIFDMLELWDSSDLTFLIQKSLSSVVGSRYFPRLVENFEGANIVQKQYLLERARNQDRRMLEHYALAYKTGLMDHQDIIWLLRLLMDDGVSLQSVSSLRDPYAYSAHGRFAAIGNLSEKEIVERNKSVIEGLLNDVQRDLHLKLRAGDPLIKGAYEELRASNLWPGRRLSAEDKAAHNAYLRRLYTGTAVKGCGRDLRAVQDNESED